MSKPEICIRLSITDRNKFAKDQFIDKIFKSMTNEDLQDELGFKMTAVSQEDVFDGDDYAEYLWSFMDESVDTDCFPPLTRIQWRAAGQPEYFNEDDPTTYDSED